MLRGFLWCSHIKRHRIYEVWPCLSRRSNQLKVEFRSETKSKILINAADQIKAGFNEKLKEFVGISPYKRGGKPQSKGDPINLHSLHSVPTPGGEVLGRSPWPSSPWRLEANPEGEGHWEGALEANRRLLRRDHLQQDPASRRSSFPFLSLFHSISHILFVHVCCCCCF